LSNPLRRKRTIRDAEPSSMHSQLMRINLQKANQTRKHREHNMWISRVYQNWGMANQDGEDLNYWNGQNTLRMEE